MAGTHDQSHHPVLPVKWESPCPMMQGRVWSVCSEDLVVWSLRVVGCVHGWLPRGRAKRAATPLQWETHCSWLSICTGIVSTL